ncbi:hypothetical protein AAFC00_002476 [Neodothiora populina]|uniref:Rad4-domain-containing protein n=1 Tax=Neodothiora populina TaxID=2781224 RepID=A0ABR3P7J2_9PEZI
MPPYVPRKRHSPAPVRNPPSSTKKRPAPATKTKTGSAKPSLFDTLDAPKPGATAEETRALLATLGGDDDEDDEDYSGLSDVASDEFEDVPTGPPFKRRRVDDNADDDDDQQDGVGDESEEMDFEDVDMSHQGPQASMNDNDDDSIEDINVSLNDDGTVAAEAGTAGNKNVKKGPSKRDRQIRIRTHMIHVQSLIFHNAVRNSWLNDKELQESLVNSLPDGIKKEVDRWQIDMGYKKPAETRKGKKGKRRGTKGKNELKEKRDGRDWGIDADRLEHGVVNMSRGDPLMRLLKILVAYWKKRFTVTAPGIRKIGYMPLRRLADSINHWTVNKDDEEEHGERIDSIKHFRKLAKRCEGSRDVGAQLFTALIRGLGIETRMVASLQPVGFGWSKAEDAAPKKPKPATTATATAKSTSDSKTAISIADSDSDSDSVREIAAPKHNSTSRAPRPGINSLPPQKPTRASTKSSKSIVDQSDSSELSSAPSEDDDSIIDITPTAVPASKKRPTKKFDRDLPFPHYWSEVLSPVSKTYIPVDSIVLSTVASTPDLLFTFEPRGKVSDLSKQVICYTLAYNADSTAKDVTVRYLKKHQLPGRTKGFRMQPDRLPIYNKRGKVLRYEEQDWFTTVLLPFLRHPRKITEAELKEDTTDLKPFKPAAAGEGKQKLGEESLQWYKQSADYVLERHLRREEALLPNSKPVREFTSGKGDKAKTEPVYSRADVVSCKTVESWHKEGRAIKVGEQPLKMVPVRAVTLIRKREMEEAQRETGEKLKQGLYGIDQTDWIIPPPIGPDRSIPKNAFGNMDCYVPSMVPRGAVHVKLKGCAKLCRKLDIDYAEACVGFEFGKQRAVPILFGVVVAEENRSLIVDAWRAEQEIQKRKEDVKREALVLHMWRKFVMGLRIVERMKAEYKSHGGTNEEEVNPFVNREKHQKKIQSGIDLLEDADMPKDEPSLHDDNDDYPDGGSDAGGGFFLPEDEPEEDPYAGGGGFFLDGEEEETQQHSEPEAAPKKASGPISLQSAHRHLNQSNKTDSEGSDDDDHEEEMQQNSDIVEARPSKSRRIQGQPAAATSHPRKRPVTRKVPAKSQPKARTRGKASKASVTPSETSGPSASDLTDLASDVNSDADGNNDKYLKPSLSTRRGNKQRRSSPRVVITPRMSRIGSLKSRFFKDGGTAAGRKVAVCKDEDVEMGDSKAGVQVDDDDVEDDDDEEEEEEEEEEEIVVPRRTTARTRKSLA